MSVVFLHHAAVKSLEKVLARETRQTMLGDSAKPMPKGVKLLADVRAVEFAQKSLGE